jgi:hypothetical protein
MHAADIVRGHHLHQAAIIVEDRNLRGKAVREMRLWAARLIDVVAEL